MNARLRTAIVVAVLLLGLASCKRAEPPTAPKGPTVKLLTNVQLLSLVLPEGRWRKVDGKVEYAGKLSQLLDASAIPISMRTAKYDLQGDSQVGALMLHFIHLHPPPNDLQAVDLILADAKLSDPPIYRGIRPTTLSDGTDIWILRAEEFPGITKSSRGFLGAVFPVEDGIVVATVLINALDDSTRQGLLDSLEESFRAATLQRQSNR